MPLLEIDLKGLDRESTRHRQAAISALEASLKEIEDRQDRQIMALEKDDDPDGILYRRIRERVVELESQRAKRP